jgi:hypothetical protein
VEACVFLRGGLRAKPRRSRRLRLSGGHWTGGVARPELHFKTAVAERLGAAPGWPGYLARLPSALARDFRARQIESSSSLDNAPPTRSAGAARSFPHSTAPGAPPPACRPPPAARRPQTANHRPPPAARRAHSSPPASSSGQGMPSPVAWKLKPCA